MRVEINDLLSTQATLPVGGNMNKDYLKNISQEDRALMLEKAKAKREEKKKEKGLLAIKKHPVNLKYSIRYLY